MSEKSKSENGSKLKRFLVAAAVGISSSVVGLAHSGDKIVPGTAVAVAGHERQATQETDPEKYLRSPERDTNLEAQARAFSNLIIADAAKHPDHGVSFDDKIDGKEDGRGILTNRIEADSKVFTFKVRVEENEDGGYELGEGGRYVEATSSFTYVKEGEKFTEGESVLYERIGEPGDDGYGAWNVRVGGGTTSENGQGMGGSAEAGPDSFDPEKSQGQQPPTVDEMLSTQEQAAVKFSQLLHDAHIN